MWKLIAFSGALLFLTLADKPAYAESEVTGVRVPMLYLYSSPSENDKFGAISRRAGRAFKKDPLPILEQQPGWLLVELDGKPTWVKHNEVRLSGDQPVLSCRSQIGGSGAGASKGIGEGCKRK